MKYKVDWSVPARLEEMKYQIVRYRKKKGGEIVRTGLTLREAQEWCQSDASKGDDWFDGYETDRSCRTFD